MSYARMKRRIEQSGSTIRKTKIKDGRRMFEYEFEQDPSFNLNIKKCNGVTVGDSLPIRLFHEVYSAATGFSIEFAVKYDDRLEIGDMIYDTKYDRYWMVTESYDKDEIYYSGKLIRCVNNRFRWQNDKGIILEYPVYDLNSTQYNSGVTEQRLISIGTSQHLFKIIADEETIKLNHGKRFFWDRNKEKPTVFVVTQNDTTASNYDKGYLTITVMEDQYNPDTDNIDEWLCDYYPTSETTKPIMYNNDLTIRNGGKKLLWINHNGDVVWSTNTTISGVTIEQVVDTESGENKAYVKCPCANKNVGKTITVTASYGDSTTECVLTVSGGV